jgi:hypothetical protein
MSDKDVFEAIKFYKLRACVEFYCMSEKSFARIYNGYGPDAWPNSMRSILTWIFGNFKEVAGVHDVEYYYSTGTRAGFNQTVKHWKQNSSIMLSVRYPMSSPSLWIHRAIAWTKLRIAMRAIAGKDAFRFYLDAYKNRIAKEAKE